MGRNVGVKRVDKQRTEELREVVCVKESHKEAGEELAKVGWTCGRNGRGMVDKDSMCSE